TTEIMTIAVSGELGSGKTVLSKKLSEVFGYEIISIGKIQRERGREMGMSTLQFNKYIEQHPEQDVYLDTIIADYGKTANRYIFDSRLAWHFAPNSFKVHLLVNTDIATKRIFNDSGRVSEKYKNVQTAKTGLIARKNSERSRFLKQYGVDINDFKNYDLVIDTGHATPKTIFSTFLGSYNAWKNKQPFNPIFFCPKTLIPTRGIKNIVKTATAGQSQKVFEKSPVQFFKHNNNFFIYRGHKKTSAAIVSGLELIACQEIPNALLVEHTGMDIESYVKANCAQDDVRNWEALHQFNYPGYVTF
ncbi:MAG: cytidylate kinase family protein, partial [Marinirhabdus sp.]